MMASGVDDRISQFPDSILILILSLLPTKDSFKTCILSKRWQYLWTFVHAFNFTCTNYRPTQNFSFVYYALAHSLSSKIKKFQLDFTDCADLALFNYSFWSRYDSLVDRCFSFAVERNVENVVLWLCDRDDYCTLPQSLYTCSSLITLDVKYCGFDNPMLISWKSLKSIKLGYLVIDDDQIVKLLSGCPSLETMELYMFEGFRCLEINSLKLKTLKLKDYWFCEEGEDLDIFAPYLQHLEISGDLYDLKCRLVDVSSVVSAKLTFNIKCIKDINLYVDEELDDEEDSCHYYHQVFRTIVQDYLQKLCYATELTIGTWFAEVCLQLESLTLSQVMCMLQFKGVPISEFKCKYLTLDLHMKKFNLYGVAGFLRVSPHVVTLNIDMKTMPSDDSLCNCELLDLAKGDNMDSQSWVLSLVFPNLKKVKIVISLERCFKDHIKWGFGKLFKLLEFLLKNATVLEKCVIISKRRICNRCSMNCLFQYSSQLAEKLSGCPRSSTKFMIIFREY